MFASIISALKGRGWLYTQELEAILRMSLLNWVLLPCNLISLPLFFFDFSSKPALGFLACIGAAVSLVPSANIQAATVDDILFRLPRGIFLTSVARHHLDTVIIIIITIRGELDMLVSFVVGCIMRDSLFALALALLMGSSVVPNQVITLNTTQSSVMIPLLLAVAATLVVGGKPAAHPAVELPVSYGLSVLFILFQTLVILHRWYHFAPTSSDTEIRGLALAADAYPYLYSHGTVIAPTARRVERPITWPVISFLAVLSSMLVVANAWLLLRNLDSAVQVLGINKPSIGFILLPVLFLAVERITLLRAIAFVKSDRATLAVSTYVNAVMRLLLVWYPAAVLVSWAQNQALSLRFDRVHAVLVCIALFDLLGMFGGTRNQRQSLFLVGWIRILMYTMLVALYPCLRPQ